MRMDREKTGRGLMFIVMVSLASVASARVAHAQVGTGTLNLHLGPPAGVTLISTTARITSASAAVSRSVAEGGGIGPFAVTGLPPASDYSVGVTSTTDNGLTCTGSPLMFPVEADTTTILFVSLTCAPPRPVPALSAGHAAFLAMLLALVALAAAKTRGSAARRSRSGTAR